MPDDNQEGKAQMSTRGAEQRLREVSSHITKEPTMTHESHPNDPQPAGDELLTISEVAAIVRAPLATLRYWRHLGTGPRSFRVGRSVRYWRHDVTDWLHQQSRDDGSRASDPTSKGDRRQLSPKRATT
jgi:predicted DNA-binding transcriptional regulator AlpA